MNNKVLVLQGFVEEYCSAGQDYGIGLDGVPIAMWADNNLYNKNVTVRWWMSDRPLSFEERLEVVVQMSVGLVKAQFDGAYSELTGHLWTDEKFIVGGHNMLHILQQNVGKWFYIEAEINS